MVFIPAFVGAVLLPGLVSAVPRPQVSPVLSTVSAATSTATTAAYVRFCFTDATHLQWIFLVQPSLLHRALVVPMHLAATVPTVVLAASGVGRRRHGHLRPRPLPHTDPPLPRLMVLVLLTGEVLITMIVLPVSHPNITFKKGKNVFLFQYATECVASFGAPAASSTPTATATSGSMGDSGSGATLTVIVAPTQGVLRYIPFAVNASVGDTIKFMWGANNHTVTKSSQLTPCNKTADALFASGTHDKDFVCKLAMRYTTKYCLIVCYSHTGCK